MQGGQLHIVAPGAYTGDLGRIEVARALSSETCERCGAKGERVDLQADKSIASAKGVWKPGLSRSERDTSQDVSMWRNTSTTARKGANPPPTK